MASHEPDDRPSFDPRTWAAAAGAARPAQADADADGARASPGVADGPGGTPQSPGGRGWLRRGMSIAVGVLLLGGGAWLALQARGARPPPPPAHGLRADPALAPHETRRTFILAGPADLPGAVAALGLSPDEQAAASGAASAAVGQAPGELRVEASLDTAAQPARLRTLRAVRADGSGVLLTRAGAGFRALPLSAALTERIKVVRGEMDANTFYSSAVSAGVTDSLIPAFAQAFVFDFDFQREIEPGDIFEAAFEERVNREGEPAAPPRLVFASLTTRTKAKSLYYFRPSAGAAGWYDSNGRSIVRALMRTPVDGARITSRFGLRTHPILGYQKLHNGVDFGAPVGTPIYASGAGLVEFAGPKGPNGNFVELLHENGWQTLYLHMDRFADGIVTGVRVRQGQPLGTVGTTGRSTGPHLHYEVHVDGRPVDPAGLDLSEGRTLSGSAMKAFVAERDRIDQARAAAG